ncbi:glycogen debranching enzyme N-terminal domain-containing protein [Candidatus Micrarchaeota archaeon]|nr:glycogen debranching enzyme N-terminal domain-containing protein [Candidatus Micrarchaeota archaeon]
MNVIWESENKVVRDDREFVIGKDVKLFNTLSLIPRRKYHGLRIGGKITLMSLGDSVTYNKKRMPLSSWYDDKYHSECILPHKIILGKDYITHKFFLDKKVIERSIHVTNKVYVTYKLPKNVILKIKPFFVMRNIHSLRKNALDEPVYFKSEEAKNKINKKTVTVIRYPTEKVRGYGDKELMTSFTELVFRNNAKILFPWESTSVKKWYDYYRLNDEILAGLPWFDDYVRDVMVSFGLFDNKTKKMYIEKLKSYMNTNKGGVPNIIGKGSNAADTGLLFVINLLKFEKEKGLDTAKKMLLSYINGTERYKMDNDYLIKVLQPKLTWMDTIDRRGKPIEINAYWYEAIRLFNLFAEGNGGEPFPFLNKIEKSLTKFFGRNGIKDVLEPMNDEDKEENENRPNFIIALQYVTPLKAMDKYIVKRMQEFFTPRGIYSLHPNSKRFHKYYQGDQSKRDEAYHRGAIWPWLLMPYIKVMKRFKVFDKQNSKKVKKEFETMKNERCINHISELVEPSTMRQCGCPAQLWSDATFEFIKNI